MASISRLRHALYNALFNVQFDEQELFDELLVQKSRLLNLLNVGQRSADEQKEIATGKVVIEGKHVAVNAEFARLVLFLSEQLECSERYIAGLLNEVMKENPNIDTVTGMELTIELFHLRRRYLVDALGFLVDAAQAAEISTDNHTYVGLAQYLENELAPSVGWEQGEMTLTRRIWDQIQQLDGIMGRADNARRGAATNTIAPNGPGGTPSLGFDVLNSRYDSLKYERRSLAITLSNVVHLGYIVPGECANMIQWLSENPSHSLTYYILATVLRAFDLVDPSSPTGQRKQKLAADNMFPGRFITLLGSDTTWKELGLRGTVLLQLTMFLTESRHHNATLENEHAYKTEKLESQIWDGVQADAFIYLRSCVQHLSAKHSTSNTSPNFSIEGQEQREVPPDDFRKVILVAFERLVRSLITHASSELRKIKQRQEDIVHARDRTRATSARFAGNVPPEQEKTEPPTRNDIPALYRLIGTLYDALPVERGLQFWGATPGDPSKMSYMEYTETTTGRLPAFLQWAVWSTSTQDLPLLAALYDMLSGLAKGQQSSELAYNFMARGGGEVLPGSSLRPSSGNGPTISWSTIFGLLDHWAQNAATGQGVPPPQNFGSFGGLFNTATARPTQHQFNIGHKELLYAQSFLHLLSTVVKYSVPVRTAISSQAQFRAIPTLVSLIPLSVPLELKGAIFDTLASFCEPGAGVPGVEICRAVWTLMERLEVINVRAGGTSGFATLATGKGVEMELEEVEAPSKLYPVTIPFLRLLGTLIHTQKRIPLKERLLDVEHIDIIPDNLGAPYRLPGIGPFSSFVIDNVFANIPNRDYLQPSDRWEINDLCLTFIERTLASYNLESLVNITDDLSVKPDKLLPLVSHPGYDIVKRLLTTSPLQNSIFSYLVEGVEGFDRNLASEELYFRNTIVRVLRIILRTLEIQDLFLDVLVPLLSDLNNTTYANVIHPRSYYTRLDQALMFGTPFIPAIATYLSYPLYPELALLSIRILSILCSSASPSTVVTLIERSRDSERISGGFMRIVGIESVDDVWEAAAYAEQVMGAGAPDPDEDRGSLSQAIRLSALEFLIENTEQDRPYPNIAHYFLFGGAVKEQRIQDPHALGARKTTLHTLMRFLNTGIPKLKGKDRGSKYNATPLLVTLPGLAERCYRIIHNLCIHPRTSEFTMRYLRTREDFFARHLASMPAAVPQALQEPFIQVHYEDGSTVTTTVLALCSFLRLRSYLFNLVALELHTLTNKGQLKSTTELLDILFGTDVEYEEEFGFPAFREIGQSQMRIIDFLQSLIFDWADGQKVQPLNLQFFSNLDLQASVRRDNSGCDIVDRTAVLSLLSGARRALQAQGAISTTAHLDQINKETTYILESCVVENNRRKVSHALLDGFESWKRLLDMSLMKCFDRLPHDRRENMLFDLLHVLPPAIRSNSIDENVSVLLAETVLASITKLREDRQHQVILQSVGGNAESGSLPAERLYAILRNALDGILGSNRVELVRGNLYAALINFIHLIASSNESPETSNQALTVSLHGSFNQSVASLNASHSLVPFGEVKNVSPGSSLVSGALSAMRDGMERLVATVSRDAIDGTEVWKTIAFMLLDALVELSVREKQSVVISALTRHGILANFVRGIKESDERLQSVLKPDPDDMNSLYVYESKMSLFTRMSQTRVGAEKLLDARLIPILAKCDYLDCRPEADQSFMDQDSFLPSAVQRYHQLLTPALQVAGGLLATLGNKHATATKQVLEFLSSHGSTLVILLKNEADHVSLGILDEIHLIVSLCSNVLPSVPKREVLAHNSGFGAIHASIVTLATRILSHERSFGGIVPQNESELQDASTPAFGDSSQSRFEATLRAKERRLRKAVIAYTGAASDFTEPEITLLLSPITNTTRLDERNSHFVAAVPTVGDAMQALEFITEDIANTLRQISDLGAEIANKNHIMVEHTKDILRHLHATLLQELDVDQKRSLICQQMEHVRQEAKVTVRTLFDTLEILLLLLWRHLDYYTEPGNMSTPPARTSILNAMRLLATTSPEQFREEVVMRLNPLLQRISSLEIDQESLGKEWQSNKAYIETMSRRLRESAGLLIEGPAEDHGTDGSIPT
ncbi:hypothetical protein Agabi119p4_11478 [Agaricus bisporus var. burnettii]|uniref:Uncharacterized protein n=1 Tax=Agaricus bisporus var. burnettii TaxID=192524 RepID=A0A8H7C039_AGABI|nr:hypothetical protein Agabi119p4_11478 [Agaricus bisporus var. burnettii]